MSSLQTIKEIPFQYLQSVLHIEHQLILLEESQAYSSINASYVLDRYVVICIIEQGSVVVSINGIQQYHIAEQGVIYHFPGQIFQVKEISSDYKARYILMSKSFTEQLNIISRLDFALSLKANPFLPLNKDAMHSILTCYELYRGILQQYDNPNRLEMLHHITMAYFLNFNYYCHKHQQSIQSTTREEEVTQHFLSSLNTHFKQNHSVRFYAEKLCLTPKYMSWCVKRVTGYSAKECICQQLISYAQYMLRCPGTSVVLVSQELSFEDLPTFGKFFRLHAGLSPREYQKKVLASSALSYPEKG